MFNDWTIIAGDIGELGFFVVCALSMWGIVVAGVIAVSLCVWEAAVDKLRDRKQVRLDERQRTATKLQRAIEAEKLVEHTKCKVKHGSIVCSNCGKVW